MIPFAVYLVVCAGVTYLIRMLPLVLVKKKIKNRFVLSFLHYIPYSVLAAMTLPASLYATGSLWSGAIGLIVGGIFAYKGKSLTLVAALSCAAALIVEGIRLLLNI